MKATHLQSTKMLIRVLSTALFCMVLPAQAAPDRASIEQALDLRQQWLPLTRDLMQAPAWTADGQAFYYQLSVEGGFQFFRQSLKHGHTELAFDHQQIAAGLAAASATEVSALQLPFGSFRYSSDESAIQFYALDAQWRCELSQPVCSQLDSKQRPKAFGVVRDLQVPASTMPVLSPDGRYQAIIHHHNLQVLDSAGQLLLSTDDGHADHFYDVDSISWAPDSSALLLVRVQPGTARYVTRVLAAPEDQLEPKVIQQLYPKPGDAVDVDQPVLVKLQAKTVTPIENALFANPYRIDQLAWQQDSSAFTFRYTERGHQRMRIIRVDAATEKATALVTEDSPTFVNLWAAFHQPLQHGEQGVVWLSERDGWAHLYRTDRSGKQLQQLTSGNWRVRQVLAVDENAGQIWFTASGYYPEQDPYYEQLFRVDLAGGNLTALTERNAHHDVVLSPDHKHYIVRYSRVDLPYVAELRQSSDGALVRTLAQADISRLTAAGFRPPQPFVAKGRDGVTDIWGLIVKPQNFDPEKSYPVIENIYAGPHDSFVPKSFWPFGFHAGGDKVIGMQALADLGFIVVQIDGMGTANRSKAFHDVAWQDLVDSGFPDRILWHQAAADSFPWYSIGGGIGIYGASAGGQSTVAALLFHPDFYRVGVAYAGCYDNRMDKISWNEQWLGYPVGPQYAASSVVEQAHLLQGQLLIINGEQDSNVDPASTMQLVDALIRADKDFDLLIVPGGEHSVGRSTGPIRYVQRRQFDFFIRHLQGSATPDWNRVQ
ncbi:DPP IV N-terminal domain-containing protein [Alkalimonas sp. MEB108]|uniref:DPP IV N-terminal domain-containing protein n=1 Tax=Alkalimonas cellulosilytica TaxID=3058395 RepID=A0ABU7J1M0_9GAMM|nr:DPP IV N-terminal domain-containing protein [Alkalimonas sp. MEB108]MEE1999900.1 DPP IV N-terminal domain-containing protein [Alkalimonas sp. MEB108]